MIWLRLAAHQHILNFLTVYMYVIDSRISACLKFQSMPKPTRIIRYLQVAHRYVFAGCRSEHLPPSNFSPELDFSRERSWGPLGGGHYTTFTKIQVQQLQNFDVS